LGVEVRVDRREILDHGLFSLIFEAEEVEGGEESSSSCALPALCQINY